MAPSYAVSNPNELACVQPNPWEEFLQESPIQPQSVQTDAAPLDSQSYFTLANKGESGASTAFRRSIAGARATHLRILIDTESNATSFTGGGGGFLYTELLQAED